MPLPDLIEIVPLAAPVRAEITVPGSKSITNRALVLAALAEGKVKLRSALWSEDTQVMTEALRVMGFDIDVQPDLEEPCNRHLTVKGLGGRIPNAGTLEEPLELFVGNAGTAARFLAALCCLGDGAYRLDGVARMLERPQAALFSALRELGYQVDSANNRLPAIIHGRDASHRVPNPLSMDAVEDAPAASGSQSRRCTVSIEESSQFASALLLCSKVASWEVTVVGESAEESPYVVMTQRLLEAFPSEGGEFQIEPDASSASYFWAAGWLMLQGAADADASSDTGLRRFGTDFVSRLTDSRQLPSLALRHWPTSGWQFDERFPGMIANPKATVSRDADLGDSIMSAIVLAPLSGETQTFTDLGRLRLQECERVQALRTELTRCGARVIEKGDTLTVHPSTLHGASIHTYNDHRMAMCFAILGLKVPGIRLQNPACVKKTFPNFFQKLAAPPPAGLGAAILDGNTGRQLAPEELFAE